MHDLGGKAEHFGPIAYTPSEPPFHEEWEARVFGIATFVQTLLGPNFDAFRAVLERLPREEYFGSYYRGWLAVLERTLSKYASGEQTVSKIKVAGTARVLGITMSRPTLPRVLNTQVFPRIVGNAKRAKRPARFAVGDLVRVRGERHDGHTRQPSYVTGRLGRITDHRGAAVFADVHAAEGRKVAGHLYTVAFDGSELWGEQAEPKTEIRMELFEPYLEPA